ncbi:MAG: ferredoxin-NADP reductase, partial [Enhydrobacter sp.]|nr:ferredoxin-NADP reductase [Enhydrobacter sp.]
LLAVRKIGVIGNGNVALDVARVLAKSPEEMGKSDIVPEAGEAIAAAPLTDIYVIGRRGPEQASFTGNELAEMGRLSRAVAVADPAALAVEAPAGDSTPERLRKAKNIEILRGFSKNVPGSKPITVHFVFNRPITRIEPGEFDLVVTCIGYEGVEFPKGEGIFPVGWARRGPTGTIPTNRGDSHAVAQRVIAWLKDRDLKSGPDPLPLSVDADGWRRIDKAEVASGARIGRPRVKLTNWKVLLDTAEG